MDADKEVHLSSCIWGQHFLYCYLEYNSQRRVTVYQRSLECEGQMYNLRFTKFRCSETLTSKDFQTYNKRQLEYHVTRFNQVANKYHKVLITAKEPNCESKVYTVKTHYMVCYIVCIQFIINLYNACINASIVRLQSVGYAVTIALVFDQMCSILCS